MGAGDGPGVVVSITSRLFRAARLSADARAVSRGKVGQRLVHKMVGRKIGPWLYKRPR